MDNDQEQYMKKTKICTYKLYLSFSYGQEGTHYNAEPQMKVLGKVEKIGRVAVNLTENFVSKISDPINTVYTGSEVKCVYFSIQNRFLKHTNA